MSLNALPATQQIAWSGRSKIASNANGVVAMTNSAGDGFTRLSLSGNGGLLPPQSGTSEPTLSEYPSAGDYGIFTNTTTGKTKWCYNDSGVIREISISGIFHNPLDHYQLSDGTDYGLCFNRCFRAMETGVTGKAGVMVVPSGIYTIATPLDLPQSNDADYSKARLLIKGYGAVLQDDGLSGVPMFRRTEGNPIAGNLPLTIEGFAIFGPDATFGNSFDSQGSVDLDLDASPFITTPANSSTGFHIVRGDRLVIRNISVGKFDIAFRITGTQDFLLSTIGMRGCLYLEPDETGRKTSRGHLYHVRIGGTIQSGTAVWAEETDGIHLENMIFEQGSPRCCVAWICNDKTDCQSMTISKTWFENEEPGSVDEAVFVQNKTANAEINIDQWQFLSRKYASLVRYVPDSEGSLVCNVSRVYKMDTHWGTDHVSGVTLYKRVEGAGDQDATWDALAQYHDNEVAVKEMFAATSLGHPSAMVYRAYGTPAIGEEPAPHYHPDLAGGSVNYYPLGTRVYYKGQIFESRVSTPSTAPTASTTTDDWEFIGAAKWIPIGQKALFALAANGNANNSGGNPLSGAFDGLTCQLKGFPSQPAIDNNSGLFDNCRVPSAYYVDGYSSAGSVYYQEWWQVINGVEVTA